MNERCYHDADKIYLCIMLYGDVWVISCDDHCLKYNLMFIYGPMQFGK